MITIDNMLMIGATSKNSGKTKLATQIIQKFSATHQIIGLKVSTCYKNDLQFHGQHETLFEKKYLITESIDNSTDKSTTRMLQANAKKVYWLQTKIEYIQEAFQTLKKQIDADAFIVCESNSLRKIVKPGFFIMIKNNINKIIKPTSYEVISFADKIILFDGVDFVGFPMNDITIENGKWCLTHKKI